MGFGIEGAAIPSLYANIIGTAVTARIESVYSIDRRALAGGWIGVLNCLLDPFAEDGDVRVDR